MVWRWTSRKSRAHWDALRLNGLILNRLTTHMSSLINTLSDSSLPIYPSLWQFFRDFIYNGNWTEWSAIWTEIKRVITKSHDREAGVRFVITRFVITPAFYNNYYKSYINYYKSYICNNSRFCAICNYSRFAVVRFCNHAFDFSPKLHDTKFNFHFIIFILKFKNIFVNRKRICLRKTHLRYLPECCSIATISEQKYKMRIC